MRISVWIIGVLLCAPAVYGDPVSRGKEAMVASVRQHHSPEPSMALLAQRMADPDLRPLISHIKEIGSDPAAPKVIALGEEHGRRELREFYPKMLLALKAANSNLNCVYFELDNSSQPGIDAFQLGQLPVGRVMYQGIQSMFEKWNLTGENAYFNWAKSVAVTVDNMNISSDLLNVSKKLGFKFIAVDEQSRADYVASVYQSMVEKFDSEEPARDAMEKAGLTRELPQNSFMYFRDEIVIRRSRKMAEKIARTISSGECNGGVFVAGALHLQRKVVGGKRVYKNGGATAMDVLHDNGLPTHLFSLLVAGGDSPRFSGVAANKRGAFYVLTPKNYEHAWRNEWEEQATILLRKN